MKKFMTDIKTMATLLMAGAAFTACSSDDSIIDEQPVNPAQKTYTLTVNASKGDGAQTRALDLSGSTLTASWATTEHVYVKKGETWATGSLQPEADGTTATLKGSLSDITIEASDNLTLQFPKSGDITYVGQQGTLADIQANFDWATASVEVESVSPSGNINPKAATTTFTNQQAIIKFTLLDKTTDATISPSALTVTDGTSTVELTSIPAATYTANGATNVLFIAFPAAGSAKTITLTATVGDDIYTYEKSGVTFTNGKYYEITVKMTKPALVDLSMVDCAGNARANGMSTANCYMVHKAGYYKLPLVYGNAIKDGTDNTAAYTGVENSNTTLTFPRHDDQAITAPWIKDNGITVTQAELLWQDAEDLVTAVGIDGDYLTLTVGKNATTQEGNAVIAAKAGETIVWSWHIWVTKQTFNNLTEIAAEVTSTTPSTSYTYSVTPVNLGWVGDATSGATGYCTYYQWGRKDAFIPSTGTANTNHTVYDISNNDVTTTAFSHTDVADVTIGGNIQYPTVHYRNTSTGSPCDTKYYNMWDAQQTSNTNAAAATVKTVYDPCPPGFCVPTIGLYNYIKSQTEYAFNNGCTYNGVFFPASGIRNYSNGVLSYVGTNGYYWSATPSSSTSVSGTLVRVFYFGSKNWAQGDSRRTSGYPVRAVAEE